MRGVYKPFIVWIFWILHISKVKAYINDDLSFINVDMSIWHQRHPRLALRTNDQLTCEKPNIYICEEPPNIVPPYIDKTCNYRNIEYHEQIYRWVAGRGCLLYTPNFLYVNGTNSINLASGCIYGDFYAPCLEIVKEDGTCACYPFDPAFEEVAEVVRNSLVPSAHGRWEKCFYEASDCCSHFMNTVASENDVSECATTFDGWTCWPPAEAGTTAYAVCSEFAYSNNGPTCHHYSSKVCFDNSTWEIQTDYSTCSVTPRLLRRYRLHIAMLSFSIAACVPAILIFFFYKRLRITRIILHRSLLIAIVLRNTLVIVSRSEIYIDELTNSGNTVLSLHGIACRVLAIAERIAANVVFVCMLVEGIYLHRLIVAVFRKKLKIRWLYAIGAVIAILPVVAWSVVMDLFNDHSCWIVYTVDHVQWILDGPRILILLINTILFIDVLRVLVTKIRNSENANQLSTTKATLFLMPLFGTQFIFTAIRPKTTNCVTEQIFYYVVYTVEGLQGFVVALLYCYINKEVHGLLKATYKKTESAVVSRIRGSNYPHITVDPISDRRYTYSTGMPTNNEDKDHYTNMKPKLYVAEIISIQASERLADILDPVYETIDNGTINSGYDCLDRPEYLDNEYNFTNASSVSIGCQDWLKPSPDNIYQHSFNRVTSKDNGDLNTSCVTNSELNRDHEYKNEPVNPRYENVDRETNDTKQHNRNDLDPEYENPDMLDEILQYIETKDNIVLDPDLLSPNRNEEDKIIFVENLN